MSFYLKAILESGHLMIVGGLVMLAVIHGFLESLQMYESVIYFADISVVAIAFIGFIILFRQSLAGLKNKTQND